MGMTDAEVLAKAREIAKQKLCSSIERTLLQCLRHPEMTQEAMWPVVLEYRRMRERLTILQREVDKRQLHAPYWRRIDLFS